MASMISQLRERVSRDPLTGLHASLPPLPDRTAVVMLDVDGLGAVNGERGQAAGDDVLRAAAGLLRELMPPGSQAFRVGADEFVRHDRPGAAPRPPSTSGGSCARRLRSRLGRTVSVGVAVGEPGESGEDVVLRAGVALDAVKKADGTACTSAVEAHSWSSLNSERGEGGGGRRRAPMIGRFAGTGK